MEKMKEKIEKIKGININVLIRYNKNIKYKYRNKKEKEETKRNISAFQTRATEKETDSSYFRRERFLFFPRFLSARFIEIRRMVHDAWTNGSSSGLEYIPPRSAPAFSCAKGT